MVDLTDPQVLDSLEARGSPPVTEKKKKKKKGSRRTEDDIFANKLMMFSKRGDISPPEESVGLIKEAIDASFREQFPLAVAKELFVVYFFFDPEHVYFANEVKLKYYEEIKEIVRKNLEALKKNKLFEGMTTTFQEGTSIPASMTLTLENLLSALDLEDWYVNLLEGVDYNPYATLIFPRPEGLSDFTTGGYEAGEPRFDLGYPQNKTTTGGAYLSMNTFFSSTNRSLDVQIRLLSRDRPLAERAKWLAKGTATFRYVSAGMVADIVAIEGENERLFRAQQQAQQERDFLRAELEKVRTEGESLIARIKEMAAERDVAKANLAAKEREHDSYEADLEERMRKILGLYHEKVAERQFYKRRKMPYSS